MKEVKEKATKVRSRYGVRDGVWDVLPGHGYPERKESLSTRFHPKPRRGGDKDRDSGGVRYDKGFDMSIHHRLNIVLNPL